MISGLWLVFFLQSLAGPMFALRTEGPEHQHGERTEHEHGDGVISLLQTSVSLGRIPEIPEEKWPALNHRLWQGEDLTREEHDLVITQMFKASSKLSDGAEHSIRVAGMFGSGTNLMQAFLELNFGLSVSEAKGTCLVGASVYEERSQVGCAGFWKHTQPYRMAYFDADNATELRPTTLVAMVRNPVSQMVSWLRQHFNLYPCFASSIESSGECKPDEYRDCPTCSLSYYPCGDNTTDALSTNFGAAPSDPSQLVSAGLPYPSIMDVWNSYGTGYEFLAQGNVPMKVIVVRYEDLVQDPDVVLKQIATGLGAEVPNGARVVEENARTFDPNAKDREAALEYIEQKLYQLYFSETTRKLMCEKFDIKLLTMLGYQDECEFD
jgi:hypothetical protein